MDEQYRVLIAEKFRNWRNLLRSLLASDYEVVVVSEVDAAIQAIRTAQQPFHVIVVDIQFTNNPDLDLPKAKNTFLDEVNAMSVVSNIVLLVSYGYSNDHIRQLARNYNIPIRYRVDKFENSFDRQRFKEIVKKAAEATKILQPSVIENQYADFQIFVSKDNKIRATSEQGEVPGEIFGNLDKELGSIELIESNMTNERFLKEFGGRLYKSLFVDKIQSLFEKTDAVARISSRGVRIRLILQNDHLAQLPWEFLYREDGNYYLSQNTNFTLSRYLDLNQPRQRLIKKTGDILDMLLIISNPLDTDRIDPDYWEKIISQSLVEQLDDHRIKLRVVKHATYENILKELLVSPPNIIQFVGHGHYSNADEKGYISLIGDDGNTLPLDDTAFSNIFLGSDNRLGLVVLAACESGKSNSPKGFVGIAPRIVQMGVPAVVAMQYPIMVDTAQLFIKSFYDAIAKQRPIDWATQWARNTVAIKMGLGGRDFATPVLYMRANDGILFE